MPQAHIFVSGDHVAADDARKADHIFGTDRIAFVRHSGRAFLAFREEFFHFAGFRFLQSADFGSEAFDACRNQGDCCHVFGMQIARQHLRRDFLRSCAQFSADILLHEWRDVCESPYRPADFSGFNAFCGMLKTFDVAFHFRIHRSQLQAECSGFRMNTMCAAHADSLFVFFGFVADDFQHVLQVFTQDVIGLFQLVTVGRIDHIGTRKAIVDPFSFFSQRFGNGACERHYVMSRLFFDFQDAVDVERCIRADFSHVFCRDFA